MRLSDYISAVTELICKHKADAQVGDALAEGCGTRKAPVSGNFEGVRASVQKAIAENKKLLGEFNGKSPLETALDPAKVRKHVLAVRYSLRPPEEAARSAQNKNIDHDDPSFIMSRILNELTSVLNVKDLGPVFGIAEKQQYEKEFGLASGLKAEPPASQSPQLQSLQLQSLQLQSLQSDSSPSQPPTPEPPKRNPKRPKSVPPKDSAVSPNSPGKFTPEYEAKMEALLAKLRREGKIL